jgi:REP element-mobilizing transposase RayT
MTRKLRLQYEGAIYHVTSRGDRREPIFRDDRDRETFLEILSQAAQKKDWQVHAYCLMNNHFHLLVETRQQKAERIVTGELKRRGWKESQLGLLPKGDKVKIAVAKRLRKETTMTLKWIAQRLQMGSWTYVFNLLAANQRRK